MILRSLLLAVLFCFASVFAEPKESTSKELQLIFSYAAKESLAVKPIGEVVTSLGKYFLGREYTAATLEINDDEELVTNLKQFDCTTLVENVLALARAIKSGSPTEEQYKKELTLIRYRDGIIDKYPSRLHYFSDWIYDNSRKNILYNVSKPLAESTIKFNVDFMSTHPQLYKHLKSNPDFIPLIKQQENEIAKREYYYVPESKIENASSGINSGDLIAFTTSIKGLDISHTGIAVKDSENKVHLLHASSIPMKVIISDKYLSDYVKDIKKMTGIIVLRPMEPVKTDIGQEDPCPCGGDKYNKP